MNNPHLPQAIQALRMKQSVAYAAVKKISTMLACAGPHDNRIRGMLTHHGATTGRWTASLVQFQNMKRPTIKDWQDKGTSEAAYRAICAGDSREMIELCYGAPLEVLSSCIRHFVQDAECHCGGNNCDVEFFGCQKGQFLIADYSAIESRLVCWLAGQEDALQEYRDGVDRYKRMASLIYGISEDQVNKHPQRFVGKQAVLGCGYSMGPPKFRMTCKKMGNYDLPVGLEEKAVQAFRASHKAVVRYWRDVDQAAKNAIIKKGQVFKVRNVAFKCQDIEGMPFLLIRLPSGRKLAYPKPRVIQSRKFENSTSIVFFGNIIGTQWGDVDTFGAKLVENMVQGVAADVMTNGAANAEAAGYGIATLIHDEAICYYKEGQTVEELVRLLTTLPSWALGLPLDAEGGIAPFYRKG